MEENKVAIYLDFENLAISAEEVYPSKERPLSLGPIIDFAVNKGNICIRKAYADWSKRQFQQYQNMLIEHGFEMIYLPATSAMGKNGSDIRIAIDAMEIMELFQNINTFIIGSGDTDFIPLMQRILARGKKVIIIGFEHSVGSSVNNNCSEFKDIEELLGVSEIDNSSTLEEKEESDFDRLYGRDLMIRYLKNRDTDGTILLSQLKNELLRLQPSFSEKKIGFSSFKDYVESMVNDVIKEIMQAKNGILSVRFMESENIKITKIDKKEELIEYLYKNFRYQRDAKVRFELSKVLFDFFKMKNFATMSEMIYHLSEKFKKIPRVSIRSYINLLASSGVFIYAEKELKGSLSNRPQKLHDTVTNSNQIEKMYRHKIMGLLIKRFPDFEDEIMDLLDIK